MQQRVFDYETILRVLQRHDVKFIVIGGVCALIYGVCVTTFDLDIVPLRHADNLKRLESALTELNAYYREHPRGRFLPNAERLDTKGHHLLMTDLGALDVLGTVTGGRGYEELLAETIEIDLAENTHATIVTLEMLIQLKRETNRSKDRQVLPILLRALEEQQSAPSKAKDKENADSEN